MTKYATRGTAKRQQLNLVLPPHQVRYLRMLAKRTGQSISAAAQEVLEEAIFGTQPTEQAS